MVEVVEDFSLVSVLLIVKGKIMNVDFQGR